MTEKRDPGEAELDQALSSWVAARARARGGVVSAAEINEAIAREDGIAAREAKTPSLGKKLNYQIRNEEKEALELDTAGKWPDNAAARADDLTIAALDNLYGGRSADRIVNARKALIRAHSHLVVARRREERLRNMPAERPTATHDLGTGYECHYCMAFRKLTHYGSVGSWITRWANYREKGRTVLPCEGKYSS